MPSAAKRTSAGAYELTFEQMELALERLLRHEDARVRAAALSAVGWAAQPARSAKLSDAELQARVVRALQLQAEFISEGIGSAETWVDAARRALEKIAEDPRVGRRLRPAKITPAALIGALGAFSRKKRGRPRQGAPKGKASSAVALVLKQAGLPISEDGARKLLDRRARDGGVLWVK